MATAKGWLRPAPPFCAPPWPLFSAKAGPTNTIPDTARANGGTGRSHPVAIGHLQRSDLANRRQVLPSADRMAESGLATTDRYMAFRKPSTMTKVLDEVLAANGAYAAEFGYKGSLPLPPARRKRSRF